jgi:hypothetical protein
MHHSPLRGYAVLENAGRKVPSSRSAGREEKIKG